MIIVSKRNELNNFKFKIDKTFSEQIMKFEKHVLQLREIGGQVSDQDLTFILIKALSLSYKKKLSNILDVQPGQKTFSQITHLLLLLHTRDVAWIAETSSPPQTP